jgi:hypothetical protein
VKVVIATLICSIVKMLLRGRSCTALQEKLILSTQQARAYRICPMYAGNTSVAPSILRGMPVVSVIYSFLFRKDWRDSQTTHSIGARAGIQSSTWYPSV